MPNSLCICSGSFVKALRSRGEFPNRTLTQPAKLARESGCDSLCDSSGHFASKGTPGGGLETLNTEQGVTNACRSSGV